MSYTCPKEAEHRAEDPTHEPKFRALANYSVELTPDGNQIEDTLSFADYDAVFCDYCDDEVEWTDPEGTFPPIYTLPVSGKQPHR